MNAAEIKNIGIDLMKHSSLKPQHDFPMLKEFRVHDNGARFKQ